MKKILFLAFALFSFTSKAQNTDTIKVMAYNLLNFPQINSARIADLKTIVQEALPDIFMVCEITSSTGANAVLNDALNQNGIAYYEKAQYVAGPDTENMLYYNSNKLGFIEQNVIATALRDVNEYVLYYKSDDIATTTDTTFFYVYVCHLKASQGYEAERNAEAINVKEYMATRPNIENVLFGGDFNLYGSSEPAWNTILNGSGVPLIDPINLPGEWHSDWGYEDHHTQSTRTTSVDGGSGGGMDDRFDFIFMSPDLLNWANQAKYIDNSYVAYGQDGNHFNAALTDAPTNTILPWSVIQALYDMSDHLPVYAEIAVQKSFNNIGEEDQGINAFFNPTDLQIELTLDNPAIDIGGISIYNMSGQEVLHLEVMPDNGIIKVNHLKNGAYVLKTDKAGYSFRFVK